MPRTMKKGDTWPPLRAGLTAASNGLAASTIDLSTASRVSLVMRLGATIFAATMTIPSALGGRVQYQWQVGDTDTIGAWGVEFEILWSSGLEETVPNAVASNETLTIEEDLR